MNIIKNDGNVQLDSKIKTNTSVIKKISLRHPRHDILANVTY